MQRLLGVATVLLLAAGVVAAAGHLHMGAGRPASAPIDASPALGPDPVSRETVLRPGQSEITGTITSATFTGAQTAPVVTPFIITVPNRGTGGLTLSGVAVGGRRSTVEWNAGQPLPLNGRGAVDLGPTRLDLSATSLRWHLDGAPRSLVPGSYSFGAPVAVGTSGLASPRDSADFTADATSAFTTSGDAGITLTPRPLHVTGPGSVNVRGALTVRTPSGAAPAAAARFGAGPYDVTLTPTGSGWAVRALVQAAREP